MSDIVLNANAVGDVVTYVAPGFLAYAGYRLRYPAPERSSGHVLIFSVVFSLPLVAIGKHILAGSGTASDVGYVLPLLAGSSIVGYVVALIRGLPKMRTLLGKLGYKLLPDGTIYAETIFRMSGEGMVQIELKDGRRVSGYPRIGPQHKEDAVNELYVLFPEFADDNGERTRVKDAAGIIIPLTEVANITLSEEPTGVRENPDKAEESPSDEPADTANVKTRRGWRWQKKEDGAQ